MNPEHMAMACCVRFACQIISRTVKGADGLTALQRASQRVSLIHEPCLQHGEKRSCTWKRARRRFRSQTSFWTVSSWASRKFLRSSLWEHLLVVWYAELSKDGLVETLQIQALSTASVEHPGDCCQMTSRENPLNNRCESVYVLCIRIFLLQSTQKQPSHVQCTSETQSSWPDAGTLLDVLAVKQP